MPDLQLGPGAALPLRYANRHILVTGATGTGKTVTLRTIARGMVAAGVPVLMVDAKGDLFGAHNPRPVVDLYQLGPDLICRALELSEAQAGAVYVLFTMAEVEGLQLATLDDLRGLCGIAAERAREVSRLYGLVSPASLAAVQRAAVRLSRDGGDVFGRPGFDLARLGRGATVLKADRVARSPALYAALVSWILLDLYHRAPERGDAAKPVLAVVIDESHLVFTDAPPALLRKLESVVRLIRSKGVCLVFASQSPADLPPGISGQLATRIQHGLRGSTPAQVKAIRAAAESMPAAPDFDAVEAIGRLGIGEALVSVPGADGVPGECKRIKIDC